MRRKPQRSTDQPVGGPNVDWECPGWFSIGEKHKKRKVTIENYPSTSQIRGCGVQFSLKPILGYSLAITQNRCRYIKSKWNVNVTTKPYSTTRISRLQRSYQWLHIECPRASQLYTLLKWKDHTNQLININHLMRDPTYKWNSNRDTDLLFVCAGSHSESTTSHSESTTFNGRSSQHGVIFFSGWQTMVTHAGFLKYG